MPGQKIPVFLVSAQMPHIRMIEADIAFERRAEHRQGTRAAKAEPRQSQRKRKKPEEGECLHDPACGVIGKTPFQDRYL